MRASPEPSASARTASERRDFIRAQTEIAPVFMCPEIRLHLITPRCSLWRARPEDLVRLDLHDPYWGFCWAGGQALARHLLDHPELVRDKRVIDFGAGGGVEAIAALLAGARSVVISDLDAYALDAAEMNAELNGVRVTGTQSDWLRCDPPDADVVLAGDVFYDEKMSEQIIERFRAWRVQTGCEVLLADADRGFLASAHLSLLATYQAPQDNGIDGSVVAPASVLRVS